MSGTKDNLNFNGFSGYYNSLYHSSYGGFDWFNMVELNKSMINNVLDYCDTGYNNVLHGSGEAVVLDTGSFYTYAQTFNLKSGIFASAWSTNQPVYIYAWANGSETGQIEVNLSQNATTIDFTKYGNVFKNINFVEIHVAGRGEDGNSCTYGQGTYGYEIALDNLKITLNAPGAHHGKQVHHLLPSHFAPGQDANPFAAMLKAGATGNGAEAWHHALDFENHAGRNYQAAHVSPDAAGPSDHASLTNQFSLPQVEHSGF